MLPRTFAASAGLSCWVNGTGAFPTAHRLIKQFDDLQKAGAAGGSQETTVEHDALRWQRLDIDFCQCRHIRQVIGISWDHLIGTGGVSRCGGEQRNAAGRLRTDDIQNGVEIGGCRAADAVGIAHDFISAELVAHRP